LEQVHVFLNNIHELTTATLVVEINASQPMKRGKKPTGSEDILYPGHMHTLEHNASKLKDFHCIVPRAIIIECWINGQPVKALC
jgi:hypothetical protein